MTSHGPIVFNLARVPVYLLLFLLAACGVNEPPHDAIRTLLLYFGVSGGQAQAQLTGNEEKVLEALNVIGDVLISAGLARDVNQPKSEGQGPLATFLKYDASRLIEGGASVYLKDRRLEIVFLEYGNRSGRLHAPTQAVCDSLERELVKRYGSGRVKVEK